MPSRPMFRMQFSRPCKPFVFCFDDTQIPKRNTRIDQYTIIHASIANGEMDQKPEVIQAEKSLKYL